jgi:hypothetical protein
MPKAKNSSRKVDVVAVLATIGQPRKRLLGSIALKVGFSVSSRAHLISDLSRIPLSRNSEGERSGHEEQSRGRSGVC